MQYPGNHHRPGGFRQRRQLVHGLLRIDGNQQHLFGVFHQTALGNGLLHPLFRQINLPHPELLGNAPGLDGAENLNGQLLIFHLAQKRGADARGATLGHAHRAHGIKPQKPQRLQIHVRKPGISAGMGMNAAEAGKPVRIAIKMHFRQGDTGNGADGDFQHFPLPAEIHQHLPVDGFRKPYQQVQQPVRQKFVPGELRVV